MTIKCTKCDSENTEGSRFCSSCATLLQIDEISASHTKTFETPIEELTRGTLFAGRYEIIEELGKGGMGKVYRVEDRKIKEDVALKLIKPEIASDKKTIERFHNELKIARKIRHKNICGMYDVGEDTGRHYITMEYVPGENLKELIQKVERLDTGTAVKIAKQVCQGLTEAHSLGVIHRDLKPSNIMIDRQGNARVMDFGIARSLRTQRRTGTGIMIGTPEYMSPEQVEGKDVDPRSDIYSLGVILFEMVTGRIPFEGDTPFTIGVKHKSEKPKDPQEENPQIPDDLNHLILKCLVKTKVGRYQSVEEMFTELVRIEKSLPTSERKGTTRKPFTSKEITVSFNLRKLLFPLFAIVFIVIAAIVLFRFLPTKKSPMAQIIENSIAIISFENQTGDNAYDYLQKAIPNLLITSLEQSGGLYVITWERMYDLLKQIGKKDVEIIDSDLGFELCRKEGIQNIVTGSIVKMGNMFATDVKVMNVETKRLLKSAGSRGEGIDSILKTQIDDLSRDIIEGLIISKGTIEHPDMAIANITTSSMEAYKYSISGWDNIRKMYFEDARKDYEKAVELDPTFATAYNLLAYIYDRLYDEEARDNAISRAKTISHKATEKERLFIDLNYAQYIERDFRKAGNILVQIIERFPQEKLAHHYLGVMSRDVGDYDQAIESYQKVLELDPAYGDAHNGLGYTYILLEEYNKALVHFKEYLSLHPDDANPHDSLAEVYLLLGRLDESISHYKEAIRIKPNFETSYFKLAYIYALKEDPVEAMKWIDKFIAMSSSEGIRQFGYLFKGFYHFWLGSSDQAFLHLNSADELALEVGGELCRAAVNWLKGVIYREKGEYALAREHNERWLNVYDKNFPLTVSANKARYNFLSGMIDIKEKNLDSARNYLTEVPDLMAPLGDFQRSWISFFSAIYEAEIWLTEGNSQKAIRIFEETLLVGAQLPPMQYVEYIIFYNFPVQKDALARAYQQIGDLDEAIVEYERLITFDQNNKTLYLIHPLYHFRLGKLYQEKNWNGKAIDQYEQFISLWQEADLNRDEFEDANQQLAELK